MYTEFSKKPRNTKEETKMIDALTKAACTMVILVCCGTVVHYKGTMTATLTPEDSQVYTETKGCHQVVYKARNERSSRTDLYSSMELSTGECWVTYNRCRFPPGSETHTGVIGDPNENYLCRGVLTVADGGAGCAGEITVDIVK